MTELEGERKLDRSAARLAVRSVALMNLAAAVSGLSQNELAARMGVSPGRISQILNGDGNVRASTLARVLRAAGYEARLEAVPAEEGVEPLPRRKPRRRGSSRQHFRYMVVQPSVIGTADGLEEQDVVQFSKCHPSDILAKSAPALVHDLDADTVFQLPEIVTEESITSSLKLVKAASSRVAVNNG